MKRRRAIPDQVVTQENRSGLIGEGSENASSPGIVKLDTIDGGNDVDTNGRDADLQRNSAAILADTYVVPDQFPTGQGYSTRSFRGAHSSNQVSNTFWVGGPRYSVDPEVRHQFSKNTCSGCHSTETGTAFFHVHGRAKGEVAPLSPFLTGYTCDGSMLGCGAEIYGEPHCVPDPVTGQQRCFGELQARVSDISSYLNSGI
jgi:hypothetical protein